MLAWAPAMKAPTPVADRIAQAVVAMATGWLVFAAAWGMFGIVGGAHVDAVSAAATMAAEPMVRWKIPYPAWDWYTGVAPAESSYYCHHPFGEFYWLAFFVWLFGHRDFVVHLPAVLMSATLPALLYGIAKERWGAPLGAVAAAAYVVVPIVVGFSSYPNYETISIFGALLFFWGHSRHMTTGKARYLLASLAGLVQACSGDWAGYVLVALTLAWAMFRAFVLPQSLTPRLRLQPYVRWWGLSVSIAAGTLLLWLWLFYHARQLSEFLAGGTSRGWGTGAKLDGALKARTDWIALSFTPLAVFIGKLAAPVCLARWFVLRRDEETYSLSLLLGALAQYDTFKQGADIRISWPLYFAPYFALSLAQLGATIASVASWLARRFAPSGAAAVAAGTALIVGLVPVAAMAHDGVASLWLWRRTGGTFDDAGTLLRSHMDMLSVLDQVLVPQQARDGRVDVHPGAAWGWEHDWRTQSNATVARAPSVAAGDIDTHPFWIARASGLTSQEQTSIPRIAHVKIYGDMWIADQREAPAPLDAYSLHEREPRFFEWLLYGGTEPVRSVGLNPDPWLTWDWRTHLGQAAPVPAGTPTTLDELRIAHNVAVDGGNMGAAEGWRERIERELDRTVETRFTGGMHLIGVRVTHGVKPRVEAWFECTETLPGDASFRVRSVIQARARFSLIPPDELDREIAWPPSLPAKLWRVGFLYKTEAVLNHRIGRELYWGYWDGTPAPRRLDGQARTTLAVLP
jgi:hypothetical protein